MMMAIMLIVEIIKVILPYVFLTGSPQLRKDVETEWLLNLEPRTLNPALTVNKCLISKL